MPPKKAAPAKGKKETDKKKDDAGAKNAKADKSAGKGTSVKVSNFFRT